MLEINRIGMTSLEHGNGPMKLRVTGEYRPKVYSCFVQ